MQLAPVVHMSNSHFCQKVFSYSFLAISTPCFPVSNARFGRHIASRDALDGKVTAVAMTMPTTRVFQYTKKPAQGVTTPK